MAPETAVMGADTPMQLSQAEAEFQKRRRAWFLAQGVAMTAPETVFFSWDTEVAGDYDLAENYWTNDVIDPDQKTTFVLGHDTNMNYMTRYNNPKVKELVDQARVEMDPAKREALYKEIQVIAKDDVHWIDLYYSPYVNVSRKNIENFYQNPLGRFFLEDTVKN